MIVAKLIGGLGNQLFQYATAYALAQKNATQVLLDIQPFEEYKLHKFALQFFDLPCRTVVGSESQKYYEKAETKRFSFFRANKYTLKREGGFAFDGSLMSQGPNTIIDGYWQCERYFVSQREALIRQLNPTKFLNEKDHEYLNLIEAQNSVAIHIRRADYVTNSNTNNVHGICGLDYYYAAIELLSQSQNIDSYFIFSDDPKWVAENLKLKGVQTHYIDHNDADRNFADLWLMSRCKHQVTANSSFSWWGSWLNQNPSKQVIMPHPWFKTKDLDTKDLYPAGSIKMDSKLV